MAGALVAAPLVKTEIAKDAKWLAHVDMEGILESSFAELGVAQLKDQIAKNNQTAVSIDVEMLLNEIKSVTAYGASFEQDAADNSIVILKTGDRLQAIFDGFIAAQELEGNEVPFQLAEGKPFQTYVMEDELFLAFPNRNYALAGKSFEQIEKAYQVIQGKAENLESADQNLVLNAEGGFFLMVTAKGIDSLKDVPPQARMLQKTKGGQISVGESEGTFRANVMLTTANEEVSVQLYQIVKGMLALASFTQLENQSMMEIVDSVEVSKGLDYLALDFQYPVEKVMDLVELLGVMPSPTISQQEAHWAKAQSYAQNAVPEASVSRF